MADIVINAPKKVYKKLCICPACKGVKTYQKPTGQLDRSYTDETCEFCKGKGMMNKIVTIELLTI